MNVVVPYTHLNEWLPVCLKADGVDATYIQMLDEGHYSRLLADLWRAGGSFILLEHDVLPWPGALRQLWDCPENYCAFPYRLSGCVGLAMGCNKFSTNLLKAYPYTFDAPWNILDGKVKHLLPYPHMHLPPVLHLNRERLQ